MRHIAAGVLRTLGWVAIVLGLFLLGLGIALRETGILGEVLLILGGLGVLHGAFALVDAWWNTRGSDA